MNILEQVQKYENMLDLSSVVVLRLLNSNRYLILMDNLSYVSIEMEHDERIKFVYPYSEFYLHNFSNTDLLDNISSLSISKNKLVLNFNQEREVSSLLYPPVCDQTVTISRNSSSKYMNEKIRTKDSIPETTRTNNLEFLCELINLGYKILEPNISAIFSSEEVENASIRKVAKLLALIILPKIVTKSSTTF